MNGLSPEQGAFICTGRYREIQRKAVVQYPLLGSEGMYGRPLRKNSGQPVLFNLLSAARCGGQLGLGQITESIVSRFDGSAISYASQKFRKASSACAASGEKKNE